MLDHMEGAEMTQSILRSAALATVLAGTTLLPAAALAGDPAIGERDWRQCRSCHMIVSPSGETIQRGGRVGSNLYGIVGQQAGTVEGFRYSAALVAAGEAGLTWTEENFVAYVADPAGFLREFTGDDTIRSPMGFQMTSGAENIFAYLQSVSQ